MNDHPGENISVMITARRVARLGEATGGVLQIAHSVSDVEAAGIRQAPRLQATREISWSGSDVEPALTQGAQSTKATLESEKGKWGAGTGW